MEHQYDSNELSEITAKIRVRIKEARLAKGIKQQEMGNILGVGKTTYSQMENGKLPISLERFLIIIKILEVENMLSQEIGYLLSGGDQQDLNVKDIKDKVDKIKDDIDQFKEVISSIAQKWITDK
ncbi:MAG: helix-turn-helix transcriptional regulator [Bacteroidia bacterium]|nr:helix-turn-helix transcriptional regulator [Bacteroidia bacterium]